MQIRLLKIFTYIVLIVVVLTFTGLPTSVYASIDDEAEKSCSDECNKDDGQVPDHCSIPDCPMFLCLSANIVSPFIPSNLSGSVYISQFVEELYLKSPVRPIFHPPAIS